MATIEAMKMEAAITTPVAGTVQRLALGSVQQVEGGDLVVVVTREETLHEEVFNFSAGPAGCPRACCARRPTRCWTGTVPGSR